MSPVHPADRDAPAWTSRSMEETERAGQALAAALVAGDLIALSGPLGAGKTRVVAGIARGLGWKGDVRSPTFTLLNEYPGRLTLFHADLYRIDAEEVDGLGFEECLERGALAVEWGDKLPLDLLESALILELDLGEATERIIAARATSARGRELVAAWGRASARATGATSADTGGGDPGPRRT